MNHRSRVLGIGMSVPSRVVTNHELATMMETSNEWIIERTGIEERHWVSEGETGATLATAASKQAIERAGLTPRDIDMIILATLSPDFNFPGTGVFDDLRVARIFVAAAGPAELEVGWWTAACPRPTTTGKTCTSPLPTVRCPAPGRMG